MQTSAPFFLASSARPQTPHRIQRSWARCADLDQHLLADPNPLSRADLDLHREANRLLLEHAQAGLCALSSLADHRDSIAILADPSGMILHEQGNPGFLSQAQRVSLQPGVNWAETHRGTNAIGTALHDGRAVCIHGPDHFLARNRILSCHAAPIFSGIGGILGILDFSGPANALHDHTLPLVQRMAQGISRQILLAQPGHRLIFQVGEQATPQAHQQALLLLDDDGLIIGANEVALQALNTNWQLIGSPYQQWISGNPTAQDSLLHRHDGQPLVGHVQHPVQARRGPIPLAKPQPSAHAVPSSPTLPAPDALTQPLLEQAIRATHAGLAILLHGETGTGKEVLARHIHAQGARAQGAFIAINCAALPEHLIESELFGYEPGAFTGARREGARGLLRQAHQGTLFLDEIGDMPLSLQTRLLRVLQEREVQPLGSEKRHALDFCLISASHQDLPCLVERGLFRADLYYRLQDMPLNLPALRQRPDLAHFILRAYQTLGGQISPAAVAVMAAHHWPGNYRELDSMLRRLRCQYPDDILLGPQHLPDSLHATPVRPPPCLDIPASQDGPAAPDTAAPHSPGDGSLQALEHHAIAQVLQACGGNISQAAKRLGIHRSTLYRKLHSH
ncbi:sigma-54-dependent Fis family transcriptional regulator [Castellaniella sp.]|uniref:sigma-54-dependent Fis family transcriptional regulator n=1 Tax=Castellaniella sp. TaxID=1955812 RepID=UPI002AFFAD0F|nr:sigma-54-dependent Fis family transcriptional regulator [Castellaniella sp.]